MNIQRTYPSNIKEKGFTLIEVLIAIAILSFGILAVASMQSSALLGTGKSNSVTQANAVAMDRLERLMSLPLSTWVGAYTPPYTGDDLFPLYTNLPAAPASVQSVGFAIADGPTIGTSVLITVNVRPRGFTQDIVFRGVKTQLSDL